MQKNSKTSDLNKLKLVSKIQKVLNFKIRLTFILKVKLRYYYSINLYI